MTGGGHQQARTLAALALGALSLAPGVASAGSIEQDGLGLPLACTLGETCWVANYVDVDGSGRARDFQCGPRTYDGHDGTDFAVRDLAVMAKGVPVVAVAPGIVRTVRDGMDDRAVTDEGSRQAVEGRECGNGVIIDHQGGWQTQYCHLRKGSVKVRAGARVDAGTPLGLVGLSGKTEFPHVHLTVRYKGTVIDPFTGRQMAAGCGPAGTVLWRAGQPVSYEPVAFYNAGFAAGEPNVEAIRKGERTEGPLPSTVPALVLWVDMLGVQAGDQLRFRIVGPDEKMVLDEEQTIEKTQARRFAFMGKKRAPQPWPAGTCTGLVTLTRAAEGAELTREATRTVTVR